MYDIHGGGLDMFQDAQDITASIRELLTTGLAGTGIPILGCVTWVSCFPQISASGIIRNLPVVAMDLPGVDVFHKMRHSEAIQKPAKSQTPKCKRIKEPKANAM